MIYLDNNSTTMPDPKIIEKIMPYLIEEYGNPETIYSLGRSAKNAIENARKNVAELINASPEQIVFTSGGTEGNNMVFNCVLNHLKMKGKNHVITDLTEHDSVLRAIDNIAIKEGFYVDYLSIKSNGTVNIDGLESLINEDTGIVSVMHMNNETGAENDIKKAADKCRSKGVLFHSDCVQSIGCCAIDVKEIGCDFLTLSGHKMHGLKGSGAVYIRNTDIIDPMIYGGSHQEFGFRGGTHNVAGIVSLGEACKMLSDNLSEYDKHTSILKQAFYNILKQNLERLSLPNEMIKVHGDLIKHGKTLNLGIEGVDSETLLIMMDSRGVCISSGSACRSNEIEPSRVLLSMGIGAEEARNSIRISFSRFNTIEDVEISAGILADCIHELKRIS